MFLIATWFRLSGQLFVLSQTEVIFSVQAAIDSGRRLK